MRNNFAIALEEAMRDRKDIVLLYGDSGNRLFNSVKELDSNRVINAGIAEANMISTSAGLAKEGFRPIAYAITPFMTSRCYEQIKVDMAYANLPIIIVGTGSGYSYASLGPTHHSFEDIAILRALPNLQIISPCDSNELRQLLPQIVESNTPTYFRIGKKREPILMDDSSEVKLGIPSALRDGTDACVIGYGTILSIALDAADKLMEKNISVSVSSFHQIKPLNIEVIKTLVKKYKTIHILEEHSKIGGLGCAILEAVNEFDLNVRLVLHAFPDQFIDKTHDQMSAWKKAGITPEALALSIENNL